MIEAEGVKEKASVAPSPLVTTPGASIWMGTGLPAAGSCGLVEIWTR